MSEKTTAIMLDEECFKCLVRGGTVHYGNTMIALADIGYYHMSAAIDAAQMGKDIYKDYTYERK